MRGRERERERESEEKTRDDDALRPPPSSPTAPSAETGGVRARLRTSFRPKNQVLLVIGWPATRLASGFGRKGGRADRRRKRSSTALRRQRKKTTHLLLLSTLMVHVAQADVVLPAGVGVTLF
jgi:hypothetical protein